MFIFVTYNFYKACEKCENMFHLKCVGLQPSKNLNFDFYCSSCKEEEEKGSSPIVCITIDKTEPSDLSSLTDFKIKKIKIPVQRPDKEREVNVEFEKNRNHFKEFKNEDKIKKKKESKRNEKLKTKKPLVFQKYKAKYMDIYPLMNKNKFSATDSNYIHVD